MRHSRKTSLGEMDIFKGISNRRISNNCSNNSSEVRSCKASSWGGEVVRESLYTDFLLNIPMFRTGFGGEWYTGKL